MKHLIEKLKEQIANSIEYGNVLDAASWGMQEGVLITANEARQIVEALEGKGAEDMSPSEIAKKQFGDRKYYQLDFGNHLRCCILTTENGITVEHAVNGFGDEVPLSEIVFYQIN